MIEKVLIVVVALCQATYSFAQSTIRASASPAEIPGNEDSRWPSVSDDGRYVAFTTGSTNIVTTHTVNNWHTFVYDNISGQCEVVSVNNKGALLGVSLATAISANGRYVAFYGEDEGYLGAFVRDRVTQQTIRLNVRTDGTEVSDTATWWG